MRRGLAGLFFFIAAILLAIAAGGWWMQRVAFDPSTSADVAREVLKNDDVRNAVSTLIADAAAETVDIPVDQLNTTIDALTQNPNAADLVTDVISDAHARMIGSRDEPVQITGAQMVTIVRDQRVADLPAVTLAVEEVPLLNTVRTTLSWLVPIAALAGLAALILGLIAHPRRADAFFGIGVFCILAAVLAMVLGYAIPAFALPALSDNMWMDVIPAAADEQLPLISGLSLALAVVGVILIISSVGFRRRKPKNWSSPVRVGRYNEQRHWS